MDPTPTSRTRPFGSQPRLQRCRNLTPYRTFQCDKMGPRRLFYDVVVVKGTFALREGELALAPTQAPIDFADTYHDPARPTRSSVARAGDLVVTKPGTDVIVTGTARTEGGALRREWDASVVVRREGEVKLGYTLRASGPREWRSRGLRGFRLTDPAPASEVPIRYELAYGGTHPDPNHAPADGEPHRWLTHAENPCGSGHWDERVLDRSRSYPGIQWTDPRRPAPTLLCEAPLAGFGPVARWWRDRTRYAGTYDDAWLETTRRDAAVGISPDYAPDFDPRFFQSAHPALISDEPLRGDESLVLTGLSPRADRFETRLPGAELWVDLRGESSELFTHRLPLDTVHVDLDAEVVSLTWRMTLLQDFDIRTAVFLPKEPA